MEKRDKVCLVSLGCPKNLADAEVLLGHLDTHQFEITTDEHSADIIIVNTCAFIQDAQEESVDTILEAARFKEQGSCRLLVVCGCLPQRYRRQLAAELPEVDLFMGIGEAPRISELLRACTAGQVVEINAPTALFDSTLPRLRATPFYTAYVKIAEGCSNNCSYCVIPQIRGPLRSRSMADIRAEVEQLVAHGVKEIILIAQDITAYGRDRADDASLVNLLRLLVQTDITWLRLMYAYPEGIDTALLELMATEEKICPYLDLPLQHIDNTMLSAMQRRLNEAASRALVEEIRARVPDITLRTSFIVGFPGESEEQFASLRDFVAAGHFDCMGVFTYSREEGTAAANLPGQVDEETKQRRQQELMHIQQQLSHQRQQLRIGTVIPVLVEGISAESELLLQGRSPFQAPDIDGVVYITAGTATTGDIVDVAISDCGEYDLIGAMVGALDHGD